MDDLTIRADPAAAVRPAGREGGGSREQGRRSAAQERERREALASLLQEQGVEAGEDLDLVVQLVTDTTSGAVRVRVIDEQSGALLAEVDAEEFAAAASAHQAIEGLLLERRS